MIKVMLVDRDEYTVAGFNEETIKDFFDRGMIGEITHADPEYMIFHIILSEHQYKWMAWHVDNMNAKREAVGNKIRRYNIFKTEEF